MKPYIIEVPATSGKGGRLSFIEGEALPFDVKRAFWIYGFEKETARGGHAHLNSDQIIICVKGEVHVKIENIEGVKFSYELKSPVEALFFPQKHWVELLCSQDAIIIVLASNKYSEDGYIKEYSVFSNLMISGES